jgi:hypothetical protein
MFNLYAKNLQTSTISKDKNAIKEKLTTQAFIRSLNGKALKFLHNTSLSDFNFELNLNLLAILKLKNKKVDDVKSLLLLPIILKSKNLYFSLIPNLDLKEKEKKLIKNLKILCKITFDSFKILFSQNMTLDDYLDHLIISPMLMEKIFYCILNNSNVKYTNSSNFILSKKIFDGLLSGGFHFDEKHEIQSYLLLLSYNFHKFFASDIFFNGKFDKFQTFKCSILLTFLEYANLGIFIDKENRQSTFKGEIMISILNFLPSAIFKTVFKLNVLFLILGRDFKEKFYYINIMIALWILIINLEFSSKSGVLQSEIMIIINWRNNIIKNLEDTKIWRQYNKHNYNTIA